MGGPGIKPQNGQFKAFETVNFNGHQKIYLGGSIK